ncbi:helix-turn-helix transcriptional regulator [Rhizobium hainanense]|uniref:DNA-binding transcriptional regulator, CsgD family n=1 Tax=Rhizobium hainanense TaxID=52131 RepID=A0A1C3WG67_9HYPH|nr:autoinducer binding domain-containing protein [Rhizobium hainanense]SCB39009.1 DNA-binding transcriptional regulator, CsgD family [Rhizobium hainanense]
MPCMTSRFSIALEIVEGICSPEMTNAAFRDLRQLYNVEALYYQALDIDGVDHQDLPIYGAGVPGWFERYWERRIHETDPVAKSGRTSSLPFDWDTMDLQSPDTRKYLSAFECPDCVLRGMTIPIHDANGNVAALSFTSYLDNEAGWRAFRRELKPELALLGMYLHQKVKSQIAPYSKIALSKQEGLCLQMFADGHRPARIGDAIGISVHTVRMHLRRAQNRLGARSKAEAVAKGVSLGFIRSQLTAAWCFLAIRASGFLTEFEEGLLYL